MSTVTARTIYTPEDLLSMPDGDHYELVDGYLVERDMSTISSWVGGQVFYLLKSFVEPGLGWAFPAECGLQCFPDAPNKVRKPDVAFVARGRIPGERLTDGFLKIAPDLVVEVVSPNDLFREVESKVEEYLGAGVRLIWIVNPYTRTVHVYRQDGSFSWLSQEDELSGEDVMPEFRCRVSEIFPPQELEEASAKQ